MAWKTPKNAKCKKEEGEVFGKLNVENKIGSEEKTVKTTSNDCIKAWPKKSKDYVD